MFQGGVSKNAGVIKAFEQATGLPVIVDTNSHLTGALGAAILAAKSRHESDFSFDVADLAFQTRGIECRKCANNCEIICIYCDDTLIDFWGNKCEKGALKPVAQP